MRKVILFGDSLTAGRIGIAYRNTIPLATEVHGIEGDTWTGTTQRVLRYLQSKHPGREKTIVIQAGANDLLIPEMGRRYPAWAPAATQLANARNSTIEDHQEFITSCKKDFKEICESSSSCSFLVCSIPILGEELASPLNRRRIERNKLMKDLVQNFSDIIWCDITSPIEQLISEKQGNSSYLPEHPEDIAKDVEYIGTDERKAAQVSQSRGLIATIDGIHPNGTGAQIIGAALANQLPW